MRKLYYFLTELILCTVLITTFISENTFAISTTEPSEDVLCLKVTNSSTSGLQNNFYYMKFSSLQYIFQEGDYIEYDVKVLDKTYGIGGIECITTDGAYFRDIPGWVDQNGIPGHPGADLSSKAYNTWYHRRLAVPSKMVGKMSRHWDVAGETNTPDISTTALYDNIVVTNSTGIQKTVIFESRRDITANSSDLVGNATASIGVSDIDGNQMPMPSGDLLSLKVTNDSSSNVHYYYMRFSNLRYTFQEGDCIEYDVKILNDDHGVGGIECVATDGSCFRDIPGWVDQNGISGHTWADISGKAYNTWYHRRLVVPNSMIGKRSYYWEVVGSCQTPGITTTALYDNIVITNRSGTQKCVIFASKENDLISSSTNYSCATASKEVLKYTNTNSEISIITPIQDGIYCKSDTSIIPKINVTDADNDTLIAKYYIDSEVSARDTKKVTNTITTQAVSFKALDMGILGEGSHTIMYEVSDGINAPVISSVTFIVDKSAPVLNPISLLSSINSVEISGSATDNFSSPDDFLYKYTLDGLATSWLSQKSYKFENLKPNTQYQAVFSAKDKVGNIADSNTQRIYTKAKAPELGFGTITSYTIELILDNGVDNSNPPLTQYQVIVEDEIEGMRYVTPEGALTQSPVWITSDSDEKITVKGLEPSARYYFQAKAKNGDNIETIPGNIADKKTEIPPPAAPANLIATATSDQITVSWDAVQGATEGYEIMADGIIIDVGTSTTYTHTDLSPGTAHTYKVRGNNSGDPGNWSVQITKSTLPVSPEIPANLTAIPQSTSITVTWSNAPGATGYDIEVDGEKVSNGPKTNYTHTSLVPGTYHTYRVCSVNSGGRSGWSTPVSVTTKQETSEVPADFTATPFSNEIHLSWDAVNGATGYDIEVDGVTIDNGVKTEYIHRSLSPGSQHMYRIRSKKGSVISDWSAAVIVSTLTESFGAPDNLNAVPDDTSIILTWNAVSGAMSYDLEADGVVINNGSGITAIISGLEPGSIYTYRVRALSDSEISEWSQPFTVTTYELPTPIFISASSTETEICLAWNSNGAAITPVWDTTGASVTYDLEADGIIIPDIQDNSYTCSGFTPNSQHIFRVRVRNGDGRSNWSIPLVKSTMFSGVNVPSGLFAIMKNTSATIVWLPMDGVVTYDIEADNTLIENITDTRYIHAGLLPDSLHTYRVRANNDTGESGWSPAIIVLTIPDGPAVPSNLSASSTISQILVSWDEVTGAAEYLIEVDGVVVENGSGTSYLHSGLMPDTMHTYRVMSKSSAGYSDWTELITLRTKSSTMNYVVDCMTGDVLNLVFSAAEIQELGQYTFTISYNEDELEVIDLCALTSKIDNAAGNITGTDIQIVQYSPGTVVFKKTGAVQNYQVWTGIVNTVRFKSKIDGQANVMYSFQ